MHVPDLLEHSIVVQEGEFLWRLEQRKKEERLALERSATEERIRAMVTLAQVHSTLSSSITLTELPCTTSSSPIAVTAQSRAKLSTYRFSRYASIGEQTVSTLCSLVY